MAANCDYKNCLCDIIHYNETINAAMNLTKQAFSDSWLGIYNNKWKKNDDVDAVNVLMHWPKWLFWYISCGNYEN